MNSEQPTPEQIEAAKQAIYELTVYYPLMWSAVKKIHELKVTFGDKTLHHQFTKMTESLNKANLHYGAIHKEIISVVNHEDVTDAYFEKVGNLQALIKLLMPRDAEDLATVIEGVNAWIEAGKEDADD